MSRFMRMMTARSQKPSDFAQSIAPDLESGAPEIESGAPDLKRSAPDSENDAPVSRVLVVRKVLPTKNVQDGHSTAERALYEAMWRLANPIEGSGNRRLEIGDRRLAAEAGIAYSTCQKNLASLESKLAVRCEGDAGKHNKGKAWTVYSFSDILRRRRAAGLTYYCRTTKGVALMRALDSKSGAPDSERGAPPTGAPDLENGAPEMKSGAPDLRTPIFIGRNDDDEREKSSSSECMCIVEAVHCATGTSIDDDVADRLLRDCRSLDASATPEEVAHFVVVKLDAWRHNASNIRNLNGLLIESIPKYFKPPAIELNKNRRIWQQQRAYA